jgi:predicted nucleic acid-binding protein
VTAEVLVDTNVHLRAADPASPDHVIAFAALEALEKQGARLVLSMQNLAEFWSVATRPTTARGGLGLSPERALIEMDRLVSFFPLLTEQPHIFSIWRGLLEKALPSGPRVHDARLVATMLANGVTHILTFDTADFAGFPGIIPLHPKDAHGTAFNL